MAAELFCPNCKTTHDHMRPCPRGEALLLAQKLELLKAKKAGTVSEVVAAEVPATEKVVEPGAKRVAPAPRILSADDVAAAEAYRKHLEGNRRRVREWREREKAKKGGG